MNHQISFIIILHVRITEASAVVCMCVCLCVCMCVLVFVDGRSKSKIMVDNHCKLLLIREETGSPSRQLSQWADVLLLVFSYADIDSLNQVGVGVA